jgi:purine-cytosine permease-like protein
MVILPYFGHATMVRVLRKLIVPFVLVYGMLLIFTTGHWHLNYRPASAGFNWQVYTAALAFSFTLAGLSWTENGNDYTRYLPRTTSKASLLRWIFTATALPQITTMLVGATAYTAFGSFAIWNSVNPFDAFLTTQQSIVPRWFVVIFLLVAIVQLFAINALDLYSSGVSLQALGLRLQRYQAVLVDGVIAGLLTVWVTFGSTFSLFMKEFVGVVIVWIAPWFGVFITDWLLRGRTYDASALQDATKTSKYYGHAGFNWNGVVAFLVGVVLATISYSKAPPPVNFPFHWMTPLSNHFGAFYDSSLHGWWGGADFSIPLGIGGSALVYWLLDHFRQSSATRSSPVSPAQNERLTNS